MPSRTQREIGAIFLSIAVIVGMATVGTTPEVSVITTVPHQTEITPTVKAEAAASKPITDPTISTSTLFGEFGFSLDSANRSVPVRPSIKAKEPLATAKPESIPSPPPDPVVAEVPRPSPMPTAARKEFVEITVELKIQDGRVAEAHVGNQQPGAEGFEATALQIARHRRYPPGTSRTEKLVLRVANQFGRKEP